MMVRSDNLPRMMIDSIPSPYPASFDGSTMRFQLALFALMAISVIGGMLAVWMAKEVWAGRRDSFPHEPLFAMRLVFMLAAFAASLRAAPEAAMMITWRENPAVAATIMVVKRWIDAFAVLPALTWMALVFIFYPSICMALVRLNQVEKGPQIPLPKLRQRVTKLARVTIILFVIAFLIAMGKR